MLGFVDDVNFLSSLLNDIKRESHTLNLVSETGLKINRKKNEGNKTVRK